MCNRKIEISTSRAYFLTFALNFQPSKACFVETNENYGVSVIMQRCAELKRVPVAIEQELINDKPWWKNYRVEYRFWGWAPFFEVWIHGNIIFAVRILRNGIFVELLETWLNLRIETWQIITLRSASCATTFDTISTFALTWLNTKLPFSQFFNKDHTGTKQNFVVCTDFVRKRVLPTKKQVKAPSLRLTLSGTNGLSIFRLKNY